MRCPKCGYISFDYSQVCSKCNKDISNEQEKLNVPPFRPNPPSLLGALTGEANESQVGIRIDESGAFASAEHQSGIKTDDSAAIGGEEIAFAESRDMDMGLEAEESREFDSIGETGLGADDLSEDFSFDEVSGDAVAMDTGEVFLKETWEPPGAAVEEEDLGLDFDALSEEAPTLEDLGAEPAPELEEAESELHLEGLPDEALAELEEASGRAGQEKMATDLDLDALGKAGLDLHAPNLEMGAGEQEEEQGQIEELNIADLKVNETGELEIGAHAVPSEDEETSFDTDELSLDLDEALPSDEGAELKLDEEKEASIDLEEIGLGDEPVLETSKAQDSGEEFIDLDDLDIELELGESEDKSS